MNLAFGKIIDSLQRGEVLERLDISVAETLSQEDLEPELVISACEALAAGISERHLAALVSLGIPELKAMDYLRSAREMLSRDNLERRLEKELGEDRRSERSFLTEKGSLHVREKIRPLGALLHITAGNQYGLALYSVIEGLLTGNVNIVKLSGHDDGLSVLVLKELIDIEPRLTEYVYVFDLPSSDEGAMKRLMEVSDAVAVWGSDRAVKAVRALAPPNMKIIEWGHRLSFAYVTEGGFDEARLLGLARNMIETGQLLCSSCQGVFVDTDSMETVHRFCEILLPLLEQCRAQWEEPFPPEAQAQCTLKRYTDTLERTCRVFLGEKTSVTAYEDSAPEVSFLYGNCWVKRLGREDIVRVLRPQKGYLQTAALLCGPEERAELEERLFRAGIVRVTAGENMSKVYSEAAHDGELSLRRYTRLVSAETPRG